MTAFRSKTIVKANDLGTILKEARQTSGKSLESAAKDLKIAYKYLEALENNRPANLPGPLYFKQYLKSYTDYLGLDFKECWLKAKKMRSQGWLNQSQVAKYDLPVWPRIIRRFVIGLTITAVVFFLALKVEEIFVAPPLDILEPQDGIAVNDKQITIIGQSKPEVELIINNQEVFVDKDGKFEAKIDLQKGLNLIKITAKKRYSRINEVQIRVLMSQMSP